jgi:hypothetical protein
MSRFIIILICLIFITTECVKAQTLVKLEKDTPAPFTGVLVDQTQMKEFRAIDTRLKLMETQNSSLKELNLRLEDRITYYRKESSSRDAELTRVKFKSFWTNVGYFTLGVLITSFAAKAAIESTRK